MARRAATISALAAMTWRSGSGICMNASLPTRQSGSAARGQLVLPIFRRLWPAGAPGSIPAGIRAKARPRPGGRGLAWSILQIRQPARPVSRVAGGGARKPSALAGLVARVLLVYHLNAALAAHHAAAFVPPLGGRGRVCDLHFSRSVEK